MNRRGTRPSGAWLLGPAAGAAAVWALAAHGMWEGAFAVALAWGLLAPTGRVRFGGALFAAAAGFGLPLAWAALHVPVAMAADETAAIMGLGHQGAIVWAATALLALGQGAAGAWLGHAVRSLLLPAPRVRVRMRLDA